MAACNSEQERASLITSTLTSEYSAAADEYNELTASTQAARDATNRMEQAQAAMGAVMEPLTTAWTNIKAGALEWVASSFAAKQSTDVLTESQRASVTAAHDAANAYRETKQASYELALSQMADVEYATSTLLPQLQELVDANGRVKQGYEERAEFLLGRFNEALGTEYTKISEIIGKNGELKQSILDVIDAKKAQILLAPLEDAFKTATLESAGAERARAQQLEAVSKALADVETAEAELTRAMEEEKDERGMMAGLDTANAQTNLAEKKRILKEQQKALEDADADYKQYTDDINAYQTASTLLMEGKTAEAIRYLEDLSAGYKSSGSAVEATTEQEKAAVEERLRVAAINLGLLTEEYKQNEKSMTEAQKTEMQNRIKAAQKEVDDLGTEAEKLGSNLVEGIGVGADGKKDWLSGKLSGIVSAAIEAGKKAGIIKSPSRKTRDVIGIPLVQGIAVGIEKAADEPMDAMRGVIDAMAKVLGEKHKTIKDTIKEHNAEIVELEKEKNERLVELEERFAADKKKKGADIKALEKQYTKDVESINEQHADKLETIYGNIKNTIDGKMQEIVSLEEKYKEDVKQIWDDLDQSIAAAQSNYDSQLESRTQSIASSLGIFAEASKNSVKGTELTRNLKSQIGVLEDYNKAIAKLEERGVDQGFVEFLKSMGVSSAGEIEAISKMSDKQLSDYVGLWEKKNALAREAATEELEPLKAETEQKIQEFSDAALDKYTELWADFTEQGGLLLEELKQAMVEAGQGGYEEIIGQIDDYTSAGEDLMGGIVAGIANKSPALIDAVTNSVNRAIQAAKDEAGIASPSKVMKKEVGANLAEGINVGWTDRIDSIKGTMADDMQGIVDRVRTAVMLENARMAQGVGVRDNGFTEVAQAVGMQTAGINSLASEYRRGSSAQVTVPLVLNGRELGRAIIDLGNAETVRTGTSLVFE